MRGHHRHSNQQSTHHTKGSKSTDQTKQHADNSDPKILVDAANVAFTNHNQPGAKASFENLSLMRQRLLDLGYTPIFIADARLRHEIDEPQRLNDLEQNGEICQAPQHTQADYFLLAFSQREGLPIVSNDGFRDREREFPDAVRRRVPFMILDGQVVIDRERLPRQQEHAAQGT